MKAIWNGRVIAQSDHTLVVEGNHYFPPESVRRDYLEDSDYHTRCAWKGEASYYSLLVDGRRNENAAWYYPAPTREAGHIRNYVAFWHGVEVTP